MLTGYLIPNCVRGSIARRSIAQVAAIIIGAIALIFVPDRCWAQAVLSTSSPRGQAQEDAVDGANGNSRQLIPIEMPAFHGIEPRLALTYDSNRGNGLVGVGWKLDGLSMVELASTGRGAPNYDTTPIYLLDGGELVECVGATVCPTGGQYATQIESYLRIRKLNGQPAAGTFSWEVWGRNGTKLTYQPGRTASGTYSRNIWLLTTAADTHGNTVQYVYTCPDPEVCYVQSITYNGAAITFYWENRSDIIEFPSSGEGNFITKRLKTIDVQVGGQRARAYALTYAAAGTTTTSRSRLASVQQYDRNATVNSTTGAVTGGTTLPPITLTYSDGLNRFRSERWATRLGTIATGGNKWLPADLNGDGRTDFVKTGVIILDSEGPCQIEVQISTGSGFSSQFWGAASGPGSQASPHFVTSVL